jgi:hypothetical protein
MMALRSLIRLRKIPAGNHGIRPASTKARSRLTGRQRWSHVQPASKVSPGYQEPIRHRAWTSRRAFLGKTARPVPLAPNAQDRIGSHVSSASRPAIFMTRSRRRERDNQQRDSPSPMHLGPASKAPTPRQSAAADCAARYRGLVKTRLQHVITAVAINLFRIGSWANGTPLAQTHCSQFAAPQFRAA